MLQTLTFVFLFPALDDRVLIVIGGDDNYSGEETSKVLSRWAKMKISSQFSTEYLDGRKSFVFSWEQKHRHIHKDALLHFLDKKGEVFVPKPRPLPTVLERNMGEKVLAGELTFQSKPNQSQATHEQGPKSKDLSPQTVKQMPTEAGTPLEKKQIHPLQGDHIGTTGLGISVWEGWLQSGTLHTTYQRPGWVPPDLLYKTVYEGNKNKSYTEFRVEETDDGSFNIKTDSELLGKFKGFLKGFGFQQPIRRKILLDDI